MKAAVLNRYDGPLTIQEVDMPVPGPDEVVVRVRACGLCGTDLKIASGKFPNIPLPHIPGHEVAGEIYKMGEKVSGLRAGDRVAVYFYWTCGQCRYCRSGQDSLCTKAKGQVGFHLNGGLAEFLKVPAINVLPIGDSLSFPQAAVLADAAATPYQAIVDKAKLQRGEVLVIVGAGGLGLHGTQIAKALGAKVIAVDVDDRHLEKAAEVGADVLLHSGRDKIADSILKETGGEGADVVMDLVGLPETLNLELEWLRRAGRFLMVGYSPTRPFTWSSFDIVSKGLQIMGVRASTRRQLAEVIKWANEKKIVPIIEERLPLEKVNQVYDRLKGGKIIGRIVLEP